jgi:hypothetical protein
VLRAALTALALAAAGPTTLVEVENTATGTTLRVPVAEDELFSVTSHHSLYDAPVTEEFRVERGRIVLVAVSSPSAAVREYFGLTRAGERHPVRRDLGEIVFRVAAGTPQRLRLGGTERSFLDLGGRGDRLVVRALAAPTP